MADHEWQDTSTWVMSSREPRKITFSHWWRRVQRCSRCGFYGPVDPELPEEGVRSAMRGAPFALTYGTVMDPGSSDSSCDFMLVQSVMLS